MPAEMSEEMTIEQQELTKNKTEQASATTTTETVEQEQLLHILVQTPKGKVVDLGYQPNIEPVASLKSLLSECLETCTYTCFHLEQRGQQVNSDVKGNCDKVILNDYTELKHYMAPKSSDVTESSPESPPARVTTEEMVLYLVEAPYDVRMARGHVTRLLEVLKAPPMRRSNDFIADDNVITASSDSSTAPKDGDVLAEATEVHNTDNNEVTKEVPAGEEGEKNKENEEKAVKIRLDLDVNDLQNRLLLNKFYDNTLLQFVPKSFKFPTSLEKEIRCLTLSGWNPPPPSRKLLGDLLYVEVVTSDETFHVTAVQSGFFVNKSTEGHFDPLPASSPCFAHELLQTLMLRNDKLRALITRIENMDSTLSNKRKSEKMMGGDLEDIATLSTLVSLHQAGRASDMTQAPSWIYPPMPTAIKGNLPLSDESTLNGIKGNTESYLYDFNRAQNDLCAGFGAELLSPPREWNEEIQTIRSMPVGNVDQKLLRYKYMHKIIDEFVAACKPASVGISEGYVIPLNPMDPKDSHVFIYNNIFFSRLIDSKESFKFSEGDDACKKNSAFDVKNQKHIQSLGIEGLHTGLTAIIDYKGHRMMAQSTIPGILSSGERPARLVYGCLEHGKRIVCKEKAMKILKQLAEKLHLQERTIVNQPDLCVSLPEEIQPSGSPFDITSMENQSIRIDDDEEVPVVIRDKTTLEVVEEKDVKDESSVVRTIPHIGPLEGKLIEGSDGRIYCLEFFRLTPRDVNYVKGEKGTGLVDDNVLDAVGEDDCMCYVLRQELFIQYIQQTLQMRRREVVMETINEQKEANHAAALETTSTSVDQTTTNSSDDETKAIETINKGGEFKITPEVTKKLGAITDEVSAMKINPNVFMSKHFASDIDPAEELKDEETARKVSRFLVEKMLPHVTEAVQSQDMNATDNRNLVIYLHSLGINMRYLGKLAELAIVQEMEDSRLLEESKQRQNSMPKYWLEFLEIEMISRGFKHLMRKYLSNDDTIAAAPASTISRMLSYLLGLPKDQKLDAFDTESDSKAKNKKNDKNSDNLSNLIKSINLDMVPKELDKRGSFFSELKREIFRRFGGYKLRLIRSGTDVEVKSIPVKDPDSLNDETIVINRICRQSLLRRICQLCGIRVAQKDYNLEIVSTEVASMQLAASPPTKFSVSSFFSPIEPTDILELVPIIRSCEPDLPCPESRDSIGTARQLISQGNIEGALDAAQEGLQWVQQITNGVHKEMLHSYEVLITALLSAGDASTAVTLCGRSLFTAIQLTGFDSFETLQCHLHLVAILSEVGEYHVAMKHLKAARFITLVMGGDHHPQVVQILQRLGKLCQKTMNYKEAIACYEDIHQRLAIGGDQFNHARVLEELAWTHCLAGNFEAAIFMQRNSVVLIEQLLGTEHKETIDAKGRVNGYIRKKTEAKVAVAKKQMEDAEAEKERMRQNWLEEADSPKGNNTSTGTTKTSKNKNVKKGGKSNKKK